MEPWKALLDKIFPGVAVISAAPGESIRPGESIAPYEEPQKDPDPLKRIHLMRKIKCSSNGFARLYGAKDLEQFRRQIVYMLDFNCAEGSFNEIAFSDPMPVYADMSVAQLQYYFRWRGNVRRADAQNVWEHAPYSYVLLYLFELMNFDGNAAQLARTWLRLREYHPKLDVKMQTWFRDYYLCYALPEEFSALVHEYHLEDFYPPPPQEDKVLRFSSYSYRESRLFKERPELLPVLEQTAAALLQNMEPLFRLYALPAEGLLHLAPRRFSFYEPFRDAAVQPPEGPNRDVTISPGEHYRLRSGSWSRALEETFRPPSHGLGYLVKRTEARLRELTGFRQVNWNSDLQGMLERWAHHSGTHALFDMVEDERFSAMIDECAQYALKGRLPEGLLPCASAIARELEAEPMKTIQRLRETRTGDWKTQFQRQGKLLENLKDDCPQTLPCAEKTPTYASLSAGQLRTYLTWRTKYRAGQVQATLPAYAKLYCCELLCDIGTAHSFDELCGFLLGYAAKHDKTLARHLAGWIRDYHILRQPDENFSTLLQKNHMEAWFPLQFLLTDCEQLSIFEQISSYKLTKSRFYDEAKREIFQQCFAKVLHDVTNLCETAGFDLRNLLCGQAQRAPLWTPWRGLPVAVPGAKSGKVVELFPNERYQYARHDWLCLERPELPTWAAAFAAFLLKRMEQGLRAQVGYPYPLSTIASVLFRPLEHDNKKLCQFLCADALLNQIDSAVNAFAAAHDISPLHSAHKRIRKIIVNNSEENIASPPVAVDFSQLERIRAEARENTERLIIEEDDSILKPETPGYAITESILPPLGMDWNGFRAALHENQTACINALCSDEVYRMDALLLESINELALEYVGDNLIETAADEPYIYEEYLAKWRETTQ